MLHKFEEIITTQEIKVTNTSRLVDFIVPGFIEIERLSGSPKAPPSARQNACEDGIAHVQEQEGHRPTVSFSTSSPSSTCVERSSQAFCREDDGAFGITLNLSILTQVFLGIPFGSPPPGSLPILESWLKELHNVEVLKLCKVCIEVWSATMERYQPSYLSKTKCLFLESQLRRSQLPGIATLLCRSQDLENLIVKLIPSRFVSLDLKSMEDDFDEEHLEWLKFSFPCMVSGLMTVKIYVLMGRECVDASAVDGVTARSFFEKQDKEIELVRFFLKDSVALKKMTIHFCGKPNFVEEVEWLKLLPMVAQKLTALPRASSCAELSLVYK
ncbi:hypothetical protein AAC387_Pa12g1960 [Persea americana]